MCESLLLVLRAEINGHAIHAVALVLRVAEALALENVSQVSSTVVANNLCPHHAQARVWPLAHSIWEGVPEGGPAAPGIKLVVCLVQRRIAASACVDTGVRVVLIEFARAGRLGAFLAEDAKLLCAQALATQG